MIYYIFIITIFLFIPVNGNIIKNYDENNGNNYCNMETYMTKKNYDNYFFSDTNPKMMVMQILF